MIDLSDLMDDPDFASHYQVIRRGGEWVKGRFVLHEPETLRFYGPVQPSGVKELEQLPEGDRQKGVMKFLCKLPNRLYMTHSGESAGPSDIVVWMGERYRIIQIMPWGSEGWTRAFGCRLEAEDKDAEDD